MRCMDGEAHLEWLDWISGGWTIMQHAYLTGSHLEHKGKDPPSVQAKKGKSLWSGKTVAQLGQEGGNHEALDGIARWFLLTGR